jgi:Tol biopolymer transport system component
MPSGRKAKISAKLTLVRVAAVGALVALSVPHGVAAETLLEPIGFVAVTNGEGSLQVSQFKLDGTPLRRLTTGPTDHNYPSLSRDGTRLVFTGEEGGIPEIYTRPFAVGGTATQITHPPVTATSASWSPDGKRLVYSALPRGTSAYEIFVSAADGSNPVQLTHTTDSGNTQPAFSPDGTRIAYISGGAPPQARATGPPTGFTNRVWVMEADGSGAAKLTAGPRDAYPQWLDDGTVLFAREDPATQTSRIVSITLAGAERNLSPPEHFIEPRPLPDGRSYGATVADAAGLHLVRVSRTDGSPLEAAGDEGFEVRRLGVPSTEGSAFTMSWVLAESRAATPSGAQPIAVYVLCAFGLAALIGAGVAVSRRTSAC